ncbi:6-pyruvoyl trahydropterin synthase family protein [Macrococcoides canis]|uniref:6-carboxy-5,6,7,8-tetrahydropterin synthase n=1 Tax=Macrococcoides canis TaxID=1855823 RepID=A0A4V3BG35_9STAP|nr:6-carboxytetrahydropterin synthase [Macrococcus canis]MEE1106389.1 6-carboxytetrahydropterin synthase [Macrococcus canis]TDM17246.1 hypothetical protein ETI04_04940 [Macrococcus canis]TDM20577.1 hypothetical protein ETI05_04830 [Macrococcus canis]TDM22269.1 hypothetical protein ETI02_09745 [Macrococcus canis]TDM32170.1 hypothetical protein ETI03_00330 [Macrococcus canis]
MSLDHIQNKTSAYYRQAIDIEVDFQFKTSNRIFFPGNHYKDLVDHSYSFTLTVTSNVDEYGLGIDFFKIRRLYNEHIAPTMNAPIINEVLPHINTTVENLCYFLWQSFDKVLPETASIQSIVLSENDTHRAILKRAYLNNGGLL